MMMLCFIWLADFTYKPPVGKWLDYSRSCPLSATRHLVVEHDGPVGDYSNGGRQWVIDNAGTRLYEIKEAKGAWFVKNGIVGSEDTFLYQKHDSSSESHGRAYHLWNPKYGDREIKVMGKNLAQDREGVYVGLLNNGCRITVISKSYEQKSDSSLVPHYHLEVLDLKGTVADFFSSTEVPFSFYADSKIDASSCDVFGDMAYFHEFGSRTVHSMNMALFSSDPHVKEIETALINKAFSVCAGHIEYSTFWNDTTSTSDLSPAIAFGSIDNPIPLFILAEGDKERPGYRELLQFLQAFPAQSVYEENGFLYAKCQDKFFVYDLANHIMSVYRSQTWNGEVNAHTPVWTPVTSVRDVTITTSVYRVEDKASPLSIFNASRPELIIEIDVNAFRKQIP